MLLYLHKFWYIRLFLCPIYHLIQNIFYFHSLTHRLFQSLFLLNCQIYGLFFPLKYIFYLFFFIPSLIVHWSESICMKYERTISVLWNCWDMPSDPTCGIFSQCFMCAWKKMFILQFLFTRFFIYPLNPFFIVFNLLYS